MNQKETPGEKFDRLFTFEEAAFRLEALPSYKVGENKEFQNYLAGEPIEDMYEEEWCKNVKRWTNNGKTIQRVSLINNDRAAYFNFEVEAAYPHNVACGEEIYMLQESTFDNDFELPKEDVWILDNAEVLQMKYSDSGEFIDCNYREGGEGEILQAKSELIRSATEFKKYIQNRRIRKI